MGIAELKEQLHKKIDDADDITLLGAINELLNPTDNAFQIPEKYLPGIEQGLQDYKNGDFITMEEFEIKYQKWLKD
jgi:hypothetical protein